MPLVLSHVSTTDITSSTSSVDYALTGNFSVYQLIGDGITSSAAGTNIHLRVSTDNGSTFISTSGAYYWGGRYRAVYTDGAAGSNRGVIGGDAQIVLAEAPSSQDLVSFDYSLHNVQSSSQRFHTHGLYTASKADYITQGNSSGMYDTQATITNIRILPSSGTLETGKIRLYGVA